MFQSKILMIRDQQRVERWREREKTRRIPASTRRSARFFHGRHFGVPPAKKNRCLLASVRGFQRARDTLNGRATIIAPRHVFAIPLRVSVRTRSGRDELRFSRETVSVEREYK